MEQKFNFLEKTHKVNFEERDEFYKFQIDDNQEYNISKVEIESNLVSFKHKGKTYNIFYAAEKEQIFLSIDGENYTLQLERDVSSKSKSGKQQKGDSIVSPMPGLLVKIPVAVGDKVKSGDTLAIVEAMKMQNELPAPRDGIIKSINGKEGEQVDALQVIVELE
ncbi:MAG TPA: acetyl-CoA carboxylase biotin carboxyl carrier protein subunit [Candidatus Cloacimonetes bacterium]|nr:acetyl-CoA carboxylase biotin carboxyl carrier protein subunit [Candidatus Cloacimonadota bacterium]